MYTEFVWSEQSLRRNEITRAYEPLQPYFLLRLADHFRSRIFVDVGANIGAYAMFFSTLPSIHSVFAYEPAPTTFQELKKNLSLNSLNDRVNASNRALSSREGKLAFGMISDLSGANSAVTTSIHAANQFKKVINVPAVTLDSEISSAGDRLVLKIDVEGHESQVLTGGSRLLAENQVLLQIEEYDANNGRSARLLENLGYNCLAHIGPDYYFTNAVSCFSSQVLLNAFQSATESLVASNIRFMQVAGKGPQRSTKVLPCGIKVEFSGFSQAVLKRLRRPFFRSR